MNTKSITKTITGIVAVIAVLATPFLGATDAQARGGSGKRPHCSAQPVPGQPGVRIVTCTTARP